MPREKYIENAVVTYAKGKGFLAYKFTSPTCRGVPDRLCITPSGQVFFIEFKRKGHLPTSLQKLKIEELQSRHIAVFVIDDIAKGKLLIDTYPLEGYTSLSNAAIVTP